MMFRRALLGTSAGGGLGALYGVYGRCLRGHCALEWNPVVPVFIGAAVGLFLILSSRWD